MRYHLTLCSVRFSDVSMATDDCLYRTSSRTSSFRVVPKRLGPVRRYAWPHSTQKDSLLIYLQFNAFTGFPKTKPSPGGGNRKAKAPPKASPVPRPMMFSPGPKLIPAKSVYDQGYRGRLTAQAPPRVSSDSSEDDSGNEDEDDDEDWI